MTLALAGCGDETSTEQSKNSSDTTETESTDKGSSGKVLAKEEFNKMYSNPKKYKGYEVTYIGRVLQSPEVDGDGIYLQVYAKPETYDQNTIVYYPDDSFEVSEEDYVEITGVIRDEFIGENLMGGEVAGPMINASELKVVSYIDAVAPTKNTLDVSEVQNQNGYKLTLEKIELADKQTRAYFTVANESNHKINFYDFNTKLIVNGKQLEPESPYETGLEELQSEILPGTSSSGVVIYPGLEEGTTSIQVYIEGSSEDYENPLEPFKFDVEM